MFPVLRRIAAVVSVIALAGGAGWLCFGSEHLRYRTLRFVGNTEATEAQLRHLADLPAGEPLLALDLTGALDGVRRHPWVASATARRVFPDTVVISVEERQVEALLLLDNLYLVDAEGVPFRRATSPHLDHPVVTGLDPALVEQHPELARRIVSDALALLDAAQGHAGLHASDISEVRFDPESGYALVLRNGGEVLIGFRPADDALGQLDALASRGVTLAPSPLRIDLGSLVAVVVTPL